MNERKRCCILVVDDEEDLIELEIAQEAADKTNDPEAIGKALVALHVVGHVDLLHRDAGQVQLAAARGARPRGVDRA